MKDYTWYTYYYISTLHNKNIGSNKIYKNLHGTMRGFWFFSKLFFCAPDRVVWKRIGRSKWVEIVFEGEFFIRGGK